MLYRIVSFENPWYLQDRYTLKYVEGRGVVSGLTRRETTDDYTSFVKINTRLLNPPNPLKSVPLRIYIPSSPKGTTDEPGFFKVMQTLMPPRAGNRMFFLTVYPFHLVPIFRSLLTSLLRSAADTWYGIEDADSHAVPE